MNKMKKFITLLTAGCMVLTLIGCGNTDKNISEGETNTNVSEESPAAEEMTIEMLVKKMADAAAGKMMTKVTAEMDMSMSMGIQGITMDMSMNSKTDTLVSMDPYASYAESEVTMIMGEEQITETTQNYIVMEDEVCVSYIHTNSGDQWQKMEIDLEELFPEMQMEQNVDYSWLREKPVTEMTLMEEKQALDGREVYVLTSTLTGQEMQQALNGVDDLENMFEQSGMEMLDFTGLSVPSVFYIDAETYLPIMIEMNIEGMTEMMNNLFAGLTQEDEETSVEDAEEFELDMSIDISNVHAVYSNISYDPVEVPAVPKEVLEQFSEENTIE